MFDLDDLRPPSGARFPLPRRPTGALAQTWWPSGRAFAAIDRPEFPRTPDWINIDHRQEPAFAPGEMRLPRRPIGRPARHQHLDRGRALLKQR